MDEAHKEMMDTIAREKAASDDAAAVAFAVGWSESDGAETWRDLADQLTPYQVAMLENTERTSTQDAAETQVALLHMARYYRESPTL